MHVKHLVAHCLTRFRVFACGISIDEIRDELFLDSWKMTGFRYGSCMVIELIEMMQLADASDANLSIDSDKYFSTNRRDPILPNVLDPLDWIQALINVWSLNPARLDADTFDFSAKRSDIGIWTLFAADLATLEPRPLIYISLGLCPRRNNHRRAVFTQESPRSLSLSLFWRIDEKSGNSVFVQNEWNNDRLESHPAVSLLPGNFYFPQESSLFF